MIIRHLKINWFRGIKELEWGIESRFACLVGPGDSTKSTILSALELALSPFSNLVLNDTDFHMSDVGNDIEITVTIGQLPKDLMQDKKFGLELRGWSADGKIHDEPEETDEPVLTIRFSADDSLEGKWVVLNDRKPDGVPIGQNDRAALGLVRISSNVDQHLSWGRGSALLRVGDTQTNLKQVIAEANRKAREIVSQADLEALAKAVEKTQKEAIDLGVKPFKNYTPGLDTRAIPGRSASLTIYDGAFL